MADVLLAEHDQAVREMLRRYLARDGRMVREAATTEQALAALEQTPPGEAAGVAVIDLTMPGLDPRRLRRALGQCPAVFLVAPGPRPRGLAGPGQRRWLTRPFGPALLTGTVRDLLRAGPVAAGGQTIEFAGRSVHLTATEYVFLTALLAAPGRPRTRAQLLAAAGGSAAARSVDVHIAALRAKLGGADVIRTVRGVGFVLDPAPPAGRGRSLPGRA